MPRTPRATDMLMRAPICSWSWASQTLRRDSRDEATCQRMLRVIISRCLQHMRTVSARAAGTEEGSFTPSHNGNALLCGRTFCMRARSTMLLAIRQDALGVSRALLSPSPLPPAFFFLGRKPLAVSALPMETAQAAPAVCRSVASKSSCTDALEGAWTVLRNRMSLTCSRRSAHCLCPGSSCAPGCRGMGGRESGSSLQFLLKSCVCSRNVHHRIIYIASLLRDLHYA
ncbi:hypothetical protein C8R46DRAFT_283599 [Mycena filopes]|nr:hypothetical protein C8R46DRAFT_283599 [Mycena filopes]